MGIENGLSDWKRDADFLKRSHQMKACEYCNGHGELWHLSEKFWAPQTFPKDYAKVDTVPCHHCDSTGYKPVKKARAMIRTTADGGFGGLYIVPREYPERPEGCDDRTDEDKGQSAV